MKKDSTTLVITFVVLIFLLIISISASVLYTVNNYLESRRSNVPVFVFFKENVSKNQALEYTQALKKMPQVKSVKFIDKNQSLTDILSKLNLPKQQFRENPLPYSLEVFLKSQFATDISHIKALEKTIKSNNLIDEVRAPYGLFTNISETYSTFREFAYILLGVFVLLEIVILALLLKIVYEHKRDSYNKLKLFGISRIRIFFMFLKQTMLSVLWGSILACFLSAIGLFLYMNYVTFVSAYKDTILFSFVVSTSANIILSFLIVTILSLFVFFIEDEKI